MNDFEIEKQLVEVTHKVATKRSELKQLQEDEENYLKEREERATQALATLQLRIKSARSLLDETLDQIQKNTVLIRDLSSSFGKRIDNEVEKLDSIVTSLLHTQESLEKQKSIITTTFESAKSRVDSLSTYEKELKKREQDVQKKYDDATTKLQEAQELAYWHRNGEEYVGP